MTASTAGHIRVRYTNAHENNHITLLGPVRSEQLALGSTSTRDRYFVEFQMKGSAKEDDFLLLEYKADTATEVDGTSTLLLPVTVADTTNGKPWPTYLTAADFGLTATDVAVGTGWTEIGRYKIPAQTAVKIGHESPMNSYAYAVFTFTNDV